MKRIFIIITFLILSGNLQSQAYDMQALVKQYPQLSTYGTQKSQTQNQVMDFDFTDYTDSELLILDSLGVLEVLLDTVEVEEPKYFGYEFFNTPDKFAVFDNMPIPGDYRLGAGDQLTISIWGDNNQRTRHMVSRDGDIFIDGVGQINISGLTISEAENVLRERFSDTISTLRGRKPSTFLSLSLGQLKSINITFVGEVINPGIHAVHPFSDITTALLQVGGIDTVGTLRNIKVMRNNNLLSTFDFYEFLVDGKTPQNVRLMNGDVIFVPPRKSILEIEGEVNRPGVYEAKDGDSIINILNHAGGLTAKAQPNIEFYRLLPINQRASQDYAYTTYHKHLDNVVNEPAFNLTKIRVLPVPDVVREVSIFGKVKSPGNYAFDDSLYVLDLLKLSGGIEDNSFLETIYTKEAEIIRQVSNNIYPQRITISLDNLLAGQVDQNIKLENRDIVLIRENSNLSEPKYVTVTGKVIVPGKYTIQEKEETLDNILSRAGGFSKNAYENGLRMYRDSTQVVLNGYDMFVADGDSIFVPEAPGVVTVNGEVHREGLVQFVKGKSLRYYIERAGGFTYDADKKNVIVQYANGNLRKKKNYVFSLISISPPIKDGSTISVFTEEPKQPLTTVIRDFVQIASSVALIALTIDRINN